MYPPVSFSQFRIILVALVLIGAASNASGQEFRAFTEALAVPDCHAYGREAQYRDHLALQLYDGTLAPPRAGAPATRNLSGEEQVWDAIVAEADGKFRGEVLRSGYLYIRFESAAERIALLQVTGHNMLYFNGEPRMGDLYSYGYMRLPVKVRRGVNEIFIQSGRFSARTGISAGLAEADRQIVLLVDDATLPMVLPGDREPLWAAVRVLNATERPLEGLSLRADAGGKVMEEALPPVPALSLRKVPFRFDPSQVNQPGQAPLRLKLMQGSRMIGEAELTLTAAAPGAHYSRTFVSEIDGSVQYYSVAPQMGAPSLAPALFLSVHGAEVEAISQARAYRPKDWGVLVAPTNRRPRGFNWEDWGRMDALEVLDIAIREFNPDPKRIYLTGHSMGGHGTWYLGATYPGRFAAIAPCAGYPTLSSYGSHDGRIPSGDSLSVAERMLLRASNPSDVIALSENYGNHGVYIFHGDADETVPVDHARRMRGVLAGFHTDFCYYEYPGGSHWFGNESVDWAPIFDYFRWHRIPDPASVTRIRFRTASPGISAANRWASVEMQTKSLEYSGFDLTVDTVAHLISGKTENVRLLSIDPVHFNPGDSLRLALDGCPDIRLRVGASEERIFLLNGNGNWEIATAPSTRYKGAHRNGAFKEAFRHRMVYVYGTAGNREENEWARLKARYDAESWYYRANGAVDVVADRDFRPQDYPDRGVVLYGNADTNRAWTGLLGDCPVQVRRGEVRIGDQSVSGDDLGVYLTWPRKDSDSAAVAVVAGSGLPGFRIANANQYFAGGSGFPDFMVFGPGMLTGDTSGLRAAGFFEYDWSLGSDFFLYQP